VTGSGCRGVKQHFSQKYESLLHATPTELTFFCCDCCIAGGTLDFSGTSLQLSDVSVILHTHTPSDARTVLQSVTALNAAPPQPAAAAVNQQQPL